MKSAIKPIVTLKAGDSIMPITGVQKDAITRDDLIKHPEKYLRLYRHYYQNATELEHDLNTNSTVKNTGSKVKVNNSPLMVERNGKKLRSGVTFNIVSGNSVPKKEEPKKVDALAAYKEMLAKKNN